MQCQHEKREHQVLCKCKSTTSNRMTPGRNQKYLPYTWNWSHQTEQKWNILCHGFNIIQWCLLHISKNCQKPILIAMCMSLLNIYKHMNAKHSYLGLSCPLLVCSHSLVMEIARYNSSPIRFWLASEGQSWPTRKRMCFILPNIWQLSSGALNQGCSALSQPNLFSMNNLLFS